MKLPLRHSCLSFPVAKKEKTESLEKQAVPHLETELPARLEAPMSLKVSSPTCKKAKCEIWIFPHFWYNLQLLIWLEGGGERHLLQTIDLYLNHGEGISHRAKRLDLSIWLEDHRRVQKYYPTTITPLTITEILALVAAHVENSPVTWFVWYSWRIIPNWIEMHI